MDVSDRHKVLYQMLLTIADHSEDNGFIDARHATSAPSVGTAPIQ